MALIITGFVAIGVILGIGTKAPGPKGWFLTSHKGNLKTVLKKVTS